MSDRELTRTRRALDEWIQGLTREEDLDAWPDYYPADGRAAVRPGPYARALRISLRSPDGRGPSPEQIEAEARDFWLWAEAKRRKRRRNSGVRPLVGRPDTEPRPAEPSAIAPLGTVEGPALVARLADLLVDEDLDCWPVYPFVGGSDRRPAEFARELAAALENPYIARWPYLRAAIEDDARRFLGWAEEVAREGRPSPPTFLTRRPPVVVLGEGGRRASRQPGVLTVVAFALMLGLGIGLYGFENAVERPGMIFGLAIPPACLLFLRGPAIRVLSNAFRAAGRPGGAGRVDPLWDRQLDG